MTDKIFGHQITRKRSGVADLEITSDSINVAVTKRENALDDATLVAFDEEGKMFLNQLQKDDIVIIKQGEEGNLKQTFYGKVVEVKAELTDEGEMVTAKCYSSGVALQRMRIVGEYGSQSENKYSNTITKILKGPTQSFGPEERWMRSDQDTVNGLTTYKWGTSASSSTVEVNTGELEEPGYCYYKVKIYKRSKTGVETLICEGAQVNYSTGTGNTTTIYSTLNIPETSLEDTDAIVVKVYADTTINPPTTLRATFISEVLDANKLPAHTVTVYYRVRRARYDMGGGEYDYLFYYRFGTSTDNSRITNFQYQVSDPGIITEFVNNVCGQGITSGYNMKTDYVDTIDTEVTYLEWKFDPVTKALKDLGDLLSAKHAPNAGVHWIVKNIDGYDQLLLGKIGNHSSTLQTVWANNHPIGTLTVGSNVKQYQITEADEQTNCVVTCGKFCHPINERWTEDPTYSNYWERISTYGNISMVNDGQAKAGNYWLKMSNDQIYYGAAEFRTKSGVVHFNAYAIGTNDDPPTISFWVQLYDIDPIGEWSFWDAIGGLFGVSESLTIKLYTDNNNYFYMGLNDLIREKGKWTYVEIPLLGDNEPWIRVGNPDWSNINYIGFGLNAGLEGYYIVGIDGLQINGTRIRMAYNSSKFSEVGCKMSVITDSLAKEEALTETDDSGLLAQLTKAELLRGQIDVIFAEVTTELDTSGEAGQLVYFNHTRNSNFGTRQMRILELKYMTGNQGCFTTFTLTSDLKNSYPVKPVDAYNAILKASNPDYQDRNRADLKAREINRNIPIYKKDYA